VDLEQKAPQTATDGIATAIARQEDSEEYSDDDEEDVDGEVQDGIDMQAEDDE